MAKVSLIIPVYNEADHLLEFLRVIDALSLPLEKELVIVDDCSKDGSQEILNNFQFTSNVKIIRQAKNCGKGFAIRTGIETASGDIIGVQDADFEYDPEDLKRLVEPFADGKADVVFGSRFKPGGTQVHRTFHYLVNRFLTLLSNLCSGLYLTDMETCYKLFRADIIKNVILESDRFGFEPEVTAKISRLKIRVREIPISYFPRNYLEGKKITWKDGLAAVRHILYYNLIPKDERCFKRTLPEEFIPRSRMWL